MITYFPRYFSSRSIYCYLITLALVSTFFIKYTMPFQFVLFGFVSVMIFFTYSNKLTMNWNRLSTRVFTKKLFISAMLIRIAYVVFICFYYIEMTGEPHAYHAGDELLYQEMAELWKLEGFSRFHEHMERYIGFSDSGYCWWLAIEYLLLGTHVLPARIMKCVIDAFSCVLMYNLAKRNFDESTGRMTAVFYMLMPNMWFYCGVTLKEIEMAFLVILFAERADLALRAPKITFRNLLLPGLAILAMFTFRTALAAVMVAATVGALVLSSGKQLQTWKKILYSSVFAVWMLLTVGAEMIEETHMLWEGREENQKAGFVFRAQREGGNAFFQYVSASVFAPLIFTIPFSTMVEIQNQENQMMMHGANFIKNVLSGFVIFALITLLVSGKWRRHVLPIALTCGYLVVLVFSNFAHSERFHFPVLALELMFAAFGISMITNKHKRWFNIWLIGVCIANIIWAWVKLAGRGFEI
ncbi:MAG: glycosyltransferase family 39 protein [Bacteroidales bacterium]|nr:glycosyltransferase family 39 protein [Bacteroidales bacterium]